MRAKVIGEILDDIVENKLLSRDVWTEKEFSFAQTMSAGESYELRRMYLFDPARTVMEYSEAEVRCLFARFALPRCSLLTRLTRAARRSSPPAPAARCGRSASACSRPRSSRCPWSRARTRSRSTPTWSTTRRTPPRASGTAWSR